MTTPIFPEVNPTTGALPALTEARYLAAAGKGVANGVAALNGAGVPVTAAGVAVAIVGDGAGMAADAAATTAAIDAVADEAADAAAAAAGAVSSINGTVVGAAYFETLPTEAELTAMGLPNMTVFFTPGP